MQLWYDKNGKITNEFKEEDKVLIGKSCNAPWQGGFGTTLSWKGVTVSALFSWVADRYMMNNETVTSVRMQRFIRAIICQEDC